MNVINMTEYDSRPVTTENIPTIVEWLESAGTSLAHELDFEPFISSRAYALRRLSDGSVMFIDAATFIRDFEPKPEDLWQEFNAGRIAGFLIKLDLLIAATGIAGNEVALEALGAAREMYVNEFSVIEPDTNTHPIPKIEG